MSIALVGACGSGSVARNEADSRNYQRRIWNAVSIVGREKCSSYMRREPRLCNEITYKPDICQLPGHGILPHFVFRDQDNVELWLPDYRYKCESL